MSPSIRTLIAIRAGKSAAASRKPPAPATPPSRLAVLRYALILARARNSRAASEPSAMARAGIRSEPNRIPFVIASTPEVMMAWTCSGMIRLIRSWVPRVARSQRPGGFSTFARQAATSARTAASSTTVIRPSGTASAAMISGRLAMTAPADAG